MAIFTKSAAFFAFNFFIKLVLCMDTVLYEMFNNNPMSLLLMPCMTKESTSFSRGVVYLEKNVLSFLFFRFLAGSEGGKPSALFLLVAMLVFVWRLLSSFTA